MSKERQLNVERLDREPDERSEHDEWDQLDELDAPSDLDLSPEAWRLPLSLRVVAFGFITVGTLSIVEMLLGLVLFDRINIDFLFLSLFVGRGLHKWSDSARWWAVFLSWLVLIFLAIWIPGACYVLLGGTLPPNLTFSGATIGGLVFTICLVVYLIWQLRVLRRPEIVIRFKITRFARLAANNGKDPLGKRGWRFSLGSLFATTVLAAFVMARLAADDVQFEMNSQNLTWTTPTGTAARIYYGVETSRFGVRRERLAYAVLSLGNSSPRFIQGFGVGGRHIWLRRSNGDEIELPGRHQLYEIVDEQVRTSDQRVTLAELQSFLETRPAECTIDALVQHAEEMRKGEQQSVGR